MIQQLNNFLRIDYINNGEKIEFLNAMKFYYAKKKKMAMAIKHSS